MADSWGIVINIADGSLQYLTPDDPAQAAEVEHRVEIIHTAIVDLLRRADSTDQHLSTAVNGAISDMADALGTDSIASPQDAQATVERALAGNTDAAAQVQSVLDSITPQQRAGQAPLTPLQASVLSQMQAQQHGMSVEDLVSAEQRLCNGKGIISDSWQLMSNPKVEFPKTESVDGALQSDEMINGGFDQLPDSVQHTINSPGTQNSENLQKVADIVNGGNDHFQTNTDLDRGLMHKVADMMESPEWRNGDQWDNPIDLDMPWEPEPPPTHAELERTASSVMEAVSADHQVVHDAITGEVASGNEFRDQFKVNSEHLLYNLTHEEWDDNGAAAGALFDWTKSAATGPEAGIAAATASTYAEYIGAHSNDLMHLNGSNVVGLDGVHTLGAVNPHLTYAMADGAHAVHQQHRRASGWAGRVRATG